MDIDKGRDWWNELLAEKATLEKRLEQVLSAMSANKPLLNRWSQKAVRAGSSAAAVGVRQTRIYKILEAKGGAVGTRVVQAGLREIGDHKAAESRSTVDSAPRRGEERGLWEKVGPALWKATRCAGADGSQKDPRVSFAQEPCTRP